MAKEIGISVGALQNRLRYGWEEDKLLEPQQIHLKMSRHEMRVEILKLRKQVEEYQSKIENGTLIELPCKVNDTVYFPYDFGSVVGECVDLDEGKVDGISLQKEGFWVHARYKSGLTYWHQEKDLNKDWFLTKAEAENKLAELEKYVKD